MLFAIIISASLCIATFAQPRTISQQTSRTSTAWEPRILTLVERDDCLTNPNWQATPESWTSARTDENAVIWWRNISEVPTPNAGFASELGRRFGGKFNGFKCGIGEFSNCLTPGCATFQANSDPAWAYQLTLAVVNLHTFFNDIYIGIGLGQQGYQALITDMSAIFFPWKNPEFLLGDAAFWIVAIFTTLLGLPAAVLSPLNKAVAGTAVAAGAFVAAGVQQASYSSQPDFDAKYLTEKEGLAIFGKFAERIGSTTRNNTEIWANQTLNGQPDRLNMTILDYLRAGTFVNQETLPSRSMIELHYKQQMVSRTINKQWMTQKVFVTFRKTTDPLDTSGPNATRYYSEADGGVYYLYRYSEDGILKGHLDRPWGLNYLNGSDSYGISGNDITKASAGAFRVGSFNYTQTLAQDRMMSSLSSNGTLTPFLDGAGWEGTWTLPVCDIGEYNWNTQYGNRTSRYGMLPCCCGPNCRDTKAFVKAANMVGFQTLLRGCKIQLAGTDIEFNKVDYGFGWKTSFPLTWAAWSTAKKGGVGFALVFGILLAGTILVIIAVNVSAGGRRTYQGAAASSLYDPPSFPLSDYSKPAPSTQAYAQPTFQPQNVAYHYQSYPGGPVTTILPPIYVN